MNTNTPIPGEPDPDEPNDPSAPGGVPTELPEQRSPADPIVDPRIPMPKEPSHGV